MSIINYYKIKILKITPWTFGENFKYIYLLAFELQQEFTINYLFCQKYFRLYFCLSN